MTDITYICSYEGRFYKPVVIDLHSRLVVGWSMQVRMHIHFVVDSLTITLWHRKLKYGLIIYSDQGSQFGSNEFTH